MFDLEEVIKGELVNVLSSGEIEKSINETLGKMIKDVVGDYIDSYNSDFKKILKEKIKDSLNVDLGKISFPEYSTLMLNCIKSELDQAMETTAKENIHKTFENYFKPLTKNEWKLSEIIEKFKESIKGEDYEYGECTIIVCPSDSTCDVYLDKEENTGKYSCDYSLRIHTGDHWKGEEHIWALEIDGDDMSKYKGDSIFGFDRFLFQMYSMSCKIEIDETCFDACYGECY